MNTYVRHMIVAVSEVTPLVLEHLADRNKRSARVLLSGYSVGVTSLRMRTFARAAKSSKLYCAGCGLAATFFAVESDASDKQVIDKPHLNLYGMLDGEEILFTHDHVIARSLGGQDSLSNTQVMCRPCNTKKSVGEQAEAKLRKALTSS